MQAVLPSSLLFGGPNFRDLVPTATPKLFHSNLVLAELTNLLAITHEFSPLVLIQHDQAIVWPRTINLVVIRTTIIVRVWFALAALGYSLNNL